VKRDNGQSDPFSQIPCIKHRRIKNEHQESYENAAPHPWQHSIRQWPQRRKRKSFARARADAAAFTTITFFRQGGMGEIDCDIQVVRLVEPLVNNYYYFYFFASK
jgi:hypothetical protein